MAFSKNLDDIRLAVRAPQSRCRAVGTGGHDAGGSFAQEGDALSLRPHVEAGEPWSSLKAALARGMSEDFMESGREQPEQQDRPELDAVFQ